MPGGPDKQGRLRHDFIKSLNFVCGRPVEITFRDHNVANADKFLSMNVDCDYFHVSGLHTPLGVVPYATLRANDVFKLRLPLDSN